MKPVSEIYSEFLFGNIRFHRRIESDIFRDALMFHTDKKYCSSASLCATLYEMIFTTLLVRETANPTDFVPAKENVNEQLQNLYDREEDVINVQKMTFRKITKELVGLGIITEEEKSGYDNFYTQIRNPVLHGLTFRLFEPMLGRPPAHAFEIDTTYEAVYEKVSHILIDKIHHLMVEKAMGNS